MTVTRVYRMNVWRRVLSVAALAVCSAVLVGVWARILRSARPPELYEVTAPVVILLGAVLFTIRAYRNSVHLSDTAIELRSPAGNRTLPRDRIKGRRRYLNKEDEHSPRGWHMVLEPNDDRYPKLDIAEIYRFDDVFYQWFNSLPDLDEADKHRPKPSDTGP